MMIDPDPLEALEWQMRFDSQLAEWGDWLREDLSSRARQVLFEQPDPIKVVAFMSVIEALPNLAAKAETDRDRNPALAGLLPVLADEVERSLGGLLLSRLHDALAGGARGREAIEFLERAVAVWRRAADRGERTDAQQT
jgi:hypothetical protein